MNINRFKLILWAGLAHPPYLMSVDCTCESWPHQHHSYQFNSNYISDPKAGVSQYLLGMSPCVCRRPLKHRNLCLTINWLFQIIKTMNLFKKCATNLRYSSNLTMKIFKIICIEHYIPNFTETLPACVMYDSINTDFSFPIFFVVIKMSIPKLG